MASHVKILGILNIVFGGLGVLIGLVVFLILGGVGAFVGAADQSPDSAVAAPILVIVGTFVLILLLVLSLPSIIAGFGLLHFKPWARILTIVLSVLHLLNFPFGTALGIYGLWVLLNKDTERMFQSAPVVPVVPPA